MSTVCLEKQAFAVKSKGPSNLTTLSFVLYGHETCAEPGSHSHPVDQNQKLTAEPHENLNLTPLLIGCGMSGSSW